ncbi:site-specific tyrosine recombinase XerD [Lysinibacter sp. HNR]|uniref:site-specific tyrosine recombinase XerD n=1 Tax=Lysinibacter sp. HNR TaxID=3031408 RepID=UPI002434963F|nr:site-specific tyrosine recombinase XerD [Lysinibacter sp. HNR]WGD38649.1 site-specific tyrosine recombinase XerD [Lysinibacter sp. HNR]
MARGKGDVGQLLDRAIRNFLRYVSFERGLSHNTVEAYRRDLEVYALWCTEHSITDFGQITEREVSDFLGHLVTRQDPLSASSIARVLSTVRGLHRYLHAEGLAEEDVTLELSPPKRGRKLPKAISIDQMASVLGAITGDEPIALRDKALLELLYATGARVSEITGLTVDDLAGEDNLIRVTGKGNKQRIVPYGSFAHDALSAYLVRSRPVLAARGRGTPSLFLGSRGAPLSRQSVWLIIQDAAEKSQIGVPVSPHTFRHSFATHLLQGGADVRSVQELLGHSSVATTQIYTLVTVDTLRDMYVTAHPRARSAGGGKPH